jgi:hypothetical protein
MDEAKLKSRTQKEKLLKQYSKEEEKLPKKK